jgi:2-oxoglutarate ferredoxin oxidoreductase subunit delta
MTDAAQARTRAPEAVVVDLSLCKSCGICVELCPKDVFDTDDLGRPVVARLADCTSCTFCERHCPDFAIDVVTRSRS